MSDSHLLLSSQLECDCHRTLTFVSLIIQHLFQLHDQTQIKNVTCINYSTTKIILSLVVGVSAYVPTIIFHRYTATQRLNKNSFTLLRCTLCRRERTQLMMSIKQARRHLSMFTNNNHKTEKKGHKKIRRETTVHINSFTPHCTFSKKKKFFKKRNCCGDNLLFVHFVIKFVLYHIIL